jgi:hypothetical protein
MENYRLNDSDHNTQDIQSTTTQFYGFEPYIVSALITLIGKRLVVETVRGSLTGVLMDVKPDHIILGEMYGDSRFFIRIAEIVHVMPVDN